MLSLQRIASFSGHLGRYALSFCLLAFGGALTFNLSIGPCGPAPGSLDPSEQVYLTALGVGLVLSSYLLVKSLKQESDYRFLIYITLAGLSVSAVLPFVSPRAAATGTTGIVDDPIAQLTRGLIGIAALVMFYRWTGVKNMIRWRLKTMQRLVGMRTPTRRP
jgi:hypothetical protein